PRMPQCAGLQFGARSSSPKAAKTQNSRTKSSYPRQRSRDTGRRWRSCGFPGIAAVVLLQLVRRRVILRQLRDSTTLSIVGGTMMSKHRTSACWPKIRLLGEASDLDRGRILDAEPAPGR